jgi:predicted DNA-binding protein YlxM (UPF0122 family)
MLQQITPHGKSTRTAKRRSAEMELMLWNIGLTALLGVVGWVLKDKSDEINRLQILINRTREEIAKEYVTKAEVHADINRVLDRLDRLDEKLDRLMGATNARGQ